MALQDVRINDKTLNYKTSAGARLQGTLSNDRQTIYGAQGSLTWQRVITLTQALAEDAKEKPLPTDGTWRGVIDQIAWSEMMKPPYPKGGIHVVFHLTSAPVSQRGVGRESMSGLGRP
jgi:hypothetical protein